MTFVTRSLRAALAVALGAAGVAVLGAQHASAAESFTTIAKATWAYTDSRAPQTPFVDPAGDLPVGAWRDGAGKHHQSKAYYTVDVSALRGARIFAYYPFQVADP